MLKPDRHTVPLPPKQSPKTLFDCQEKLDAAILTLDTIKGCPHCRSCRELAESALSLVKETEAEKQSNS